MTESSIGLLDFVDGMDQSEGRWNDDGRMMIGTREKGGVNKLRGEWRMENGGWKD